MCVCYLNRPIQMHTPTVINIKPPTSIIAGVFVGYALLGSFDKDVYAYYHQHQAADQHHHSSVIHRVSSSVSLVSPSPTE